MKKVFVVTPRKCSQGHQQRSRESEWWEEREKQSHVKKIRQFKKECLEEAAHPLLEVLKSTLDAFALVKCKLLS